MLVESRWLAPYSLDIKTCFIAYVTYLRVGVPTKIEQTYLIQIFNILKKEN